MTSKKSFEAVLQTIVDKGLKSALKAAGEGEVATAALQLDKRLQKAGYFLTTYLSNKRPNQTTMSHFFDRRWAIYGKSEKRPGRYSRCLYCSTSFPNMRNKKTKNCGAYEELVAFEKKLVAKGIIKR